MITAQRFRSIRNLFVAFAILGMAGCSHTGSAERIQANTHGAALYELNCQACHEGKNLDLIKQPPSLAGLFQRSQLPSGAPATDESVRKTIMEGRGIMPPFRQSLTADDIDDLIHYLHTLGANGRSNSQAGHEIPPQ